MVANEIINTFKKGDPSTVNKCRKLVEQVFGENWQAKGAGIYEEGEKDSKIWGIGKITTAYLTSVLTSSRAVSHLRVISA